MMIEPARRLTLKGIRPGVAGPAYRARRGSAVQPVLVVDQGRPTGEGGRVRRLWSCAGPIGVVQQLGIWANASRLT